LFADVKRSERQLAGLLTARMDLRFDFFCDACLCFICWGTQLVPRCDIQDVESFAEALAEDDTVVCLSPPETILGLFLSLPLITQHFIDNIVH